jgi:hypothetical protein
MTPRDLVSLDILRLGWGIVTAYVLWHPVAGPAYRKRFWILLAALTILALVGLRTWMRNPSLDSWLSFGSLFQGLFNLAVVGVLILRYKLQLPRAGSSRVKQGQQNLGH